MFPPGHEGYQVKGGLLVIVLMAISIFAFGFVLGAML